MIADVDNDAEIATLRAQIDALDEAIAGLLNERASVSTAIQASRVGSGRSRVDLAREKDVLDRYNRVLRMPGRDIGEAVLKYCRG